MTPPVTTTQSGSTTDYLTGPVNGGMVDLFAGYNRRLGNVVVGGQVEGTLYSDVALKSSDGGFPPFEHPQLLRSRIGLIGRAGFLARPDLLLYGLAGLEFGHFTDPDFFQLQGADGGTWAIGHTVGAGAEWKLSDHWSPRGEYRYLHFGFTRGAQSQSSGTNLTSSAFQSVNTFAFPGTVDFHVGKFGIAYGF
jgi:opacity protein-like surface antigen